jgi:hypothetical protein
MDFLMHLEGGMVFYQVFLLSPLQGLEKTRVFLKKPSPVGFFCFFLVFLGFFGFLGVFWFFWVFLPEREGF